MTVFDYEFFSDPYEALQVVEIPIGAYHSLNGEYGVIRRVPTEAHPRSTNGWIRLITEKSFACGNWETYRGAMYSSEKLEESDRRRLVLENEAIFREESKARAVKAQATANNALEFWRQCDSIELSDPHPYLKRKQVNPVATIRESTAQRFKDFFGYFPKEQSGRLLVIPLRERGAGGEKISSLQIITEAGEKFFLSGGKTGGCFWQSEGSANPEYVAIGEGLATVLSYIQNKPEKILGVSAFNAGNLPKVAKVIRYKYPEATIIILGDNDPKSGTGQKFAKVAFETISGKKILDIVSFTTGDKTIFKLITGSEKDPSDFDDLYIVKNYLKSTGWEAYR